MMRSIRHDAAFVNISVLVGIGFNHAGWIFHGGKANGTAMKMMCWIFIHFVNGSVMMAIRHDASVSVCTAKDGWSFNCRNAGVHTNYSNKMKFFLWKRCTVSLQQYCRWVRDDMAIRHDTSMIWVMCIWNELFTISGALIVACRCTFTELWNFWTTDFLKKKKNFS